jgi:hypothetical protein
MSIDMKTVVGFPNSSKSTIDMKPRSSRMILGLPTSPCVKQFCGRGLSKALIHHKLKKSKHFK